MNKKYLSLIMLLAFVIGAHKSYAQYGRSRKKAIRINVGVGYNSKSYHLTNFYTDIKPFSQIELNYITKNSGTFEVNRDARFAWNLMRMVEFSPNRLSPSIGVQILGKKGRFQQFSIVELSQLKTQNVWSRKFTSLSTKEEIDLSVRNTLAMFSVALHYEAGKYFGNYKRNPLSFGVAIGVMPSFRHFNYRSADHLQSDANGKMLELNATIAPIVSAKLSKKAHLDFKILQSFKIVNNSTITENNDLLPPDSRKLVDHMSSKLNLSFHVVAKFLLSGRIR